MTVRLVGSDCVSGVRFSLPCFQNKESWESDATVVEVFKLCNCVKILHSSKSTQVLKSLFSKERTARFDSFKIHSVCFRFHYCKKKERKVPDITPAVFDKCMTSRLVTSQSWSSVCECDVKMRVCVQWECVNSAFTAGSGDPETQCCV